MSMKFLNSVESVDLNFIILIRNFILKQNIFTGITPLYITDQNSEQLIS